jgi:predicted nucleotidyltransferase
MNLIELNLEKIIQLCKKHKVAKLFAFGSVLKDTFNSKSDIDLIVDFEKIELVDYADNYFDFKESLMKIFNRPIDLIEEKGIKNPYFKNEVEKEKKLIYG